jgi:hypothetical protein
MSARFPVRQCALRVYAYPDHHGPLNALLDFESSHAPHHCSPADDSCQHTAFGGTGTGNRRQYTADLPIWRALRSCPQAADAATADIFVVPFLFGSATTLKWGEYRRWSSPGVERAAPLSHIAACAVSLSSPLLDRASIPIAETGVSGSSLMPSGATALNFSARCRT